MREILFRGFHKTGIKSDESIVINGETFFGFWVEWNEYGLIWKPDRLFAESAWDMRIIPKTVGQFTGLLDKNGKRIFEHDVVHCIDINGNMEEDYKSPVAWFALSWSLTSDPTQEWDVPLALFQDGNWVDRVMEIEVIGTIFDKEATPCTQD